MVKLYGALSGCAHGPKRLLMKDADGPVDVPHPFYVIDHPRGLTLFDSGLDARNTEADFATRKALETAGWTLDFTAQDTASSRLIAMDFDPEDVAYVVLSHVHFDHAGGVAQFPNATLVIQRPEFDAAMTTPGNPFVAGENFLLGHDRRLIDGEHDLFGDGTIVCCPTYGHTAGHQSLRVGSDQGPVLLTGDACYFCDVLSNRRVPPFAHSHEAMQRSLDYLNARQSAGDRLIFGHDSSQWATPPLPDRR